MHQVEVVRGQTRIEYRNLSELSVEDRGIQLRNEVLSDLERVHNAFGGLLVGMGVASGVLARLRPNAKIFEGVVGVEFAPEQMWFQYTDELLAHYQGKDVVYVHTHDETYREYVPEQGMVYYGLRRELFPSELDYQFIQEFIEKTTPTSMVCFIAGRLGCARIWPADNIELYAPTVPEEHRKLFLLLLHRFLQRLGLQEN